MSSLVRVLHMRSQSLKNSTESNAQYHSVACFLGGVRTECSEESRGDASLHPAGTEL
ncbi:hypothetical protein [Brunnivagina elsteri]|uniref:hypothetical protein n=1 Tax=Brunnivagina elsteri TaxID=1247191 RepID=UPI0013040CF0|nr:hypothetical protein [Calothrix elsteri]